MIRIRVITVTTVTAGTVGSQEGIIQEATFVMDRPLPAVTISLKKKSNEFHIVAGAFRVEANSNKKLQQLKELGYNAQSIGVNRYGLHQVSFQGFVAESEARTFLKEVQTQFAKDAWLLVTKK